uniref:TIL domain-containing protein n=1 Tax=Leptobrachium leishanense TaxID=445787 RepID=A0A8C5Q9B1_9ANUR
MRRFQFLDLKLVLALCLCSAFLLVDAGYETEPEILCPPHLVRGCKNPCFGSCANLAGNLIMCPALCELGCICPKGTYFQGDDCVPAYKCNVNCLKNKHFDPCPRFEEVSCQTMNDKPRPLDTCLPRCSCNKGYVLYKDICVKKNLCPNV